MANIVLDTLRIKYQDKKGNIVTALNDVTTTFKHGEFSVILGNSGGGKTTLLKAIIGELLINGKIFINGVDSEKLNVQDKNISYVSQDFALYPHLTVYENIAFPLSVLNIKQEEIKERVFQISEELDLTSLLNRMPKELSIGQKQKVTLARALIKKSDIYLFDEPFSNIDKEAATKLKLILKKLTKENDSTVLFVSHDTSDAYLLADRIFIIEEGLLVFEGDIKEFNASKKKAVKAYNNVINKTKWKI